MSKKQRALLKVGNTTFHFNDKEPGLLSIYQLDKDRKCIPTRLEKIEKAEDGGGTIFFDNGINIEFYHDADCCEFNYIDWESLIDCLIPDMEYNVIKIEELDTGFKFLDYITVNCYSEQNGYYSNSMEFVVNYDSLSVRSGGVWCEVMD